MAAAAARRTLFLAALCLLPALPASCSCSCSGDAGAGGGGAAVEAGSSTLVLEADRRVAMLIQDCPRDGFYDRDLSDMAPVLLNKLELARPDPLRRAKEELGLLGTAAFPAVANRFHAHFSDPMRSPLLENVVDALSFSDTDEGHALLIEALAHPQESVRSKALEGLSRRARPGDFDLLVRRLEIETEDMRRSSVAALFHADRRRAEEFFLEAFVQGTYGDLWLTAAPFFSESTSSDTRLRCAKVFERIDSAAGVHLTACAAAADDASAIAALRADLRGDDPSRRLAAVNAAQRAGLLDELAYVLVQDPSAELRAIAASSFRRAPLTDEQRTLLRGALGDPAEPVQTEALAVLCAHRDPEGLARAVAQLDGHPGQLFQSLQALRGPIQEDAELARRCFERLLERNALEEHRPLSQRGATFKAIGQMPLAAAAEFLHRVGVEAADAQIESLRAHEWLMIQASNTGDEGRTFLAGALTTERDPLRRIDLIDAVASRRDGLARRFLLELVEKGESSPLETLFAASCLIRVGPSWEVAPRLKRAAYAMQGAEWVRARTSLQCALWQWY